MQDDHLTETEHEAIDRLIPPPWGTGRRGVAWGLGIALVAGFGVLWGGGWLAPNLELEASTFGGDGPVVIGLMVTNNGARTVEILSADGSPGLEQLSVSVDGRNLPATIAPGQRSEVLASFEVTDCAAIVASDSTWGLQVRFADGPAVMERHLDVDVSDFVWDERSEGGETSWPEAITQYVCP